MDLFQLEYEDRIQVSQMIVNNDVVDLCQPNSGKDIYL